ncbi:hypothetical protein IRY55_02575 [Savagea sp. SN6]|uniref:Uncharacterized protein n=1 Tax=Savagea serpentis TaxID=2785297 RepID=A0A8J7G4L6_9BACL|nr:hypothetical protein [Savagea serpentis]MBF4500236.1 hypothetical protein [Savagea serpentis]
METTMMIGEEEYRIKATAITAMHYRNQFKADILADTFKAIGGVENIATLQELENKSEYKQMEALIDGFDTILIYQLTWAFLKTADLKTQPFAKWLDSLPYVPVTDLILQDGFLELLVGNIHRKKK